MHFAAAPSRFAAKNRDFAMILRRPSVGSDQTTTVGRHFQAQSLALPNLSSPWRSHRSPTRSRRCNHQIFELSRPIVSPVILIGHPHLSYSERRVKLSKLTIFCLKGWMPAVRPSGDQPQHSASKAGCRPFGRQAINPSPRNPAMRPASVARASASTVAPPAAGTTAAAARHCPSA